MKLLTTGALLAASASAMAIPTLQVGITGATYDNSTQTSIATAPSFTLYAFLTPGNGAKTSEEVADLLSDTYYIAAAVVPKVSESASLGSFTFAGNTVDVTGDMVYGTPPLETVVTQSSDPGDLAEHGIYETFFKEFSFRFSASNQVSPLDVQDSPALPLIAGTGMYYASFAVDVTKLSTDYAIHFDLYNSQVASCSNGTGNGDSNGNGKSNGNSNGNSCVVGDIDIDDFAPYSHDAQSGNGGGGGGGGGGGNAPEPGTLALTGLALSGVAWARRRRQRV